MRKLHFALLSATCVTALALAACGQKEEQAAVPATDEAQSLLSMVPSDTPYLAANLAPPPDAVIDTYLKRWEPVAAELQNQLGKARSELEASTGSAAEADQGERLLLALLEEFDGKFSRAGLESLGFDLQSNRVLYGMGAFPVVRVGLKDSTALRAMVQRVMDKAGMQLPELEHQGVKYWRLADEEQDANGHGDVPAGAYIAILPDHLALSVFPLAGEAELLPAFLGLSKPAESDALERLTALNRKYGYTPHGSGYLDLHKLADRFMNPETLLAKTLADSGEFDASTISEQCVTEIHGIIDNAPEMNFGITELSENALAYQYRIRHPAPLAAQLQELVSAIPAARAISDRMLELAFGLKVGAAKEFVREKMTAIVNAPYQCEHLQELNRRAQEALVNLDQPMPPFVNNFRGFRLSLTEIMMDPNTSIPNNARGHLAVHVEQPQMFVGMAQMFLPDLSEMTITPGDPPVRLPETLIPMPGMVTFAAMSDAAIGLSVGAGEEAGLPAFLDEKAGPKGTFLSASYDMKAYMEYTGRISDQVQAMEHEGSDHQSAVEAVQAIGEAAEKVMKETIDRNTVTMKMTADGLAIDGRSTFR
jgi:hypothetical protein